MEKDMAHVHFWGEMSLSMTKDEFLKAHQFVLGVQGYFF
jgi:hypothetical protein